MTVTPWIKLSEVVQINPPLPNVPADDTVVSFVPMSALDADTGKITMPEERRFAEVKKGYTPFLLGDALVGKITPCFENGKIAHAQIPHAIGAGSTEFHVLRPRAPILDTRYLLYFLRQGRILRDGEAKMTGSGGQRRVPEHFLANLDIPLPSLSQQHRIVAVLDRAETLRVKRRAMIRRIGTLEQAMYFYIFGDPVLNPCSWPMRRLGEVGSLERGVSKHRPRNNPALLGGPYPLIQTGDVANSGGYIRGYRSTYSDLGLSQSRMWPAGTLCITIAANIAKTGILTFDACFPDSVVGFTSPERETIEYVRVWMSFLQGRLEELAPESAQKNINLETLRSLEIPWPDEELRVAFFKQIRANRLLEESTSRSMVPLDSLFASLQHRAFRGEL